MSLFSSLYTGASGMLAHTRATQIISENIANSTTVGYKRSDAAFNDLLNDATNRYTANTTVNAATSAHKVARIRNQGAIQQTSSSTDLSVTGNGFFVVNQTADGSGEFLYTRAGQFNEGADGILRNTAGYALYGFATDADGVAQGSTLVPIDLSLYPAQFFETTEITAAINLDAGDTARDPHQAATVQQLPIDNLEVDYTRSLAIYDDTGTEQQISFEFRRTVGPMAHFTSDIPNGISRTDILVDDASGPTPGITDGNIFQITDGTNTLDITFTGPTASPDANEANTLDDLITAVNNFTDTNGDQVFLASLTADGEFLVRALEPTATLDISGSDAAVLGATGLQIIQDPDTVPDYTYEPDFDITTTPTATDAYPGQTDLPAITNITDPNPYNWWELTVLHTDANGNETTVTQGLLNFNGDGSLNADLDADGNSLLTLAAADLPFTTSGDVTVDVTRFTQFNGTYSTLELAQNGAPETSLQNVNIADDGTIYLQYRSDLTLPAYRIPLALFNNPDGLTSVDGTAWRVAADGSSGEPEIVEARTNGAGIIQAASLESSNVDITDEFGGLIVSQRAYSMNSQVVQAVNEMTQTLARLKA